MIFMKKEGDKMEVQKVNDRDYSIAFIMHKLTLALAKEKFLMKELDETGQTDFCVAVKGPDGKTISGKIIIKEEE